MLNRIVFTEKNKFMTLKVTDELRHGDFQSEMQEIKKSLASSNNLRKVNLDFNNLQVISLNTKDILSFIVKNVRLQNIPISIERSSKIDPVVLLSILEGKNRLLEKKKIIKDKKIFKHSFYPIFKIPFFSSKINNNEFDSLGKEKIVNNLKNVKKPFQKKNNLKGYSVINSKPKRLRLSLFLCLIVLICTLIFKILTIETSLKNNKLKKIDREIIYYEEPTTGENNFKNYSNKSLIKAINKKDFYSVKKIINSGAELEIEDNKGYTPLMLAVKNQDKELVKLLVESGANTNFKDELNDTPLVWASSMKNEVIMKLLLEHDADPDKGSFPPIMWAVIHKNLNMLKLLLQARANINSRTPDGWTALMWAVEKDNTNAIWLLLKHGARINIQNNKGNTALILATKRGNLSTIRLLLNKGGDPFVTDFNSKNSLDYARDFKHSEAIRLLENVGYIN